MRIRLFVCLFSLCGAIWAADPTGTIAGNVSDPSGAAISGAKIVATDTRTGLVHNTTTVGRWRIRAATFAGGLV